MATQNIFFDLLIQFAIKYWGIILFMIAAVLIRFFAPLIKGKAGEGLVNLAAKLRLDPKVYHLLKDVTIPSKAGTTQIDHVIVSKFGLFVIETKNYKGWIFADAKDAQWTQVIFGQKHRFQNPLRQNYAHICALSDLLGTPKDKIHGVVCFMGNAKFKTGVPEGVYLEGRYVNHIESFRTVLFSEDEVADLIQRIESGRFERGFKTNREHVQRLRSQKSEDRNQKTAVGDRCRSVRVCGCVSQENGDRGLRIETEISKKNDFVGHDFVKTPCPACGAAMVLRTAMIL